MTKFVGTYTVPNGYSGNRTEVRVVLDGKRLLHVTPSLIEGAR